MNKVQHSSNNDVLGAPPGVPIEQCHALPITRVRFADGGRAAVSFWRPSAAELALMNEGKPVRLCVLGGTHPPLVLGVDGNGELF